jgi:hypothetical protein
MNRTCVLAAAAFLAVAAVEAEAMKGSEWSGCKGREKAAARERRKAARAARRAALSRAFADGYLEVDPGGNGLELDAATLGTGYQSPCQVNARNTAAVSRVDIPDATSPTLDSNLQARVRQLQTYLAGQFATRAASAPAPLSFTGITIQSLKVRGSWRPIRNFTRIVGSETVTFTAVLSGGDSDGIEVSGSYRIVLSRGDRAL